MTISYSIQKSRFSLTTDDYYARVYDGADLRTDRFNASFSAA